MSDTATIDHSEARRVMIDSQLRPNGVTDKRLLGAIAVTPREDFLADDLKPMAYRDRALATGEGQAMAPTPLAKLIDAVGIADGHKVLVLGPLAAYAAAICDVMGAHTVTATKELARDRSGEGPFDRILILGGIEHLPEHFADMLAEHGRIGAALSQGSIARLAVGTHSHDGISFKVIDDAQVASLAAFAKPKGFTF